MCTVCQRRTCAGCYSLLLRIVIARANLQSRSSNFQEAETLYRLAIQIDQQLGTQPSVTWP